MNADDRYEAENDNSIQPPGNPKMNDYTSRSGQSSSIPVQKDEAKVKDPIDPAMADTDEQLGEYSPLFPVLFWGYGIAC
jgi:hypothetical protein